MMTRTFSAFQNRRRDKTVVGVRQLIIRGSSFLSMDYRPTQIKQHCIIDIGLIVVVNKKKLKGKVAFATAQFGKIRAADN